MAVISPNPEKIEPSLQSMSQSPSKHSPSGKASSTADSSDQDTSSPIRSSQLEAQSQPSLRSEEYRQLFRLPREEVLIQDFNCALQENFILQGHMYLFVHYICFYSNLFGFETKKIIPFEELTSVRRAKTAGIFPTAIEIIAAGKKYFFTSFLSRDEALKLIDDGWLQHGHGAKVITDQQESTSELRSQENEIVTVEGSKSSKQSADDLDSTESNKDVFVLEDSEAPHNGEAEILSTSSGAQNNLEENAEIVTNTDCCSSSGKFWEHEDSNAPKVPEDYMLVSESKFPIKVEEFFSLFFSDDAFDFVESYHKRCGDKDFRCTPWRPHEKYGHARDISFQHPIKIYLGARYGSPREIQKYRVYRNSHLVIETSQEITDVPYGDYFRVEGRWDVERDGDELDHCCKLRVYVSVAFSKRTIWKGKIVQSTVDECRDAFAMWIDHAHKFLKEKNLEKEANLITNDQVQADRQERTMEHPERSHVNNDSRMPEILSGYNGSNQETVSLHENSSGGASIVSSFRDSIVKLCSSFKSQSRFPSIVVIIVAVIFLLMQISIIVLLARPQQIHVIPQADYLNSMHSRASEGPEAMALLDKQINHLKEEMLMVETLLEKMRFQHGLLKVQLQDLAVLRERQTR